MIERTNPNVVESYTSTVRVYDPAAVLRAGEGQIGNVG